MWKNLTKNFYTIMRKERIEHKIEIFSEIVKSISDMSVSQTIKVGCIAVKKDFTKIGAIGYNGRYPGCPINPETGGEEKSLKPGESGFTHAEINMVAKFKEIDPENYFVILTLSPCEACLQALLIQGFRDIYFLQAYRETQHLEDISNNVKDLIVGDISQMAEDIVREHKVKRRKL